MSYVDRIVNGYRMHGNNVTGHRVQAKSRFRYLLRSVTHDLSYDRAAMIPSIRARLDNPTDAQLQVLNKCEQIVNRNKSFFGRFINALYRVRYNKTIYTL